MPADITSVGAVTGHGLGCEPLLSAVLAGRSAIRPLTRFSAEGLCSTLASEAPSDEVLVAAASRLGQPPARDRATRLLLAAAAEALDGRDLRPSVRRAVVVGTTKGALELAVQGWEAGGVPTEDVLGAPARALALACGARGPVLTVGAACASSAVALGEALALLEDGVCDEVVVGGTEALHPFVYRGFHALKALSPSPAAPFDAGRSGLSLGEGAAVLVLEAPGCARRSPVAVLGGFGASTDGFDQTAPDPTGSGLATACHRALQQAKVGVEAVERYHAHGTGTLLNDRMEAAVHASLFGGRDVPVYGIKGSVGHTLGAAGALDATVCALTLRRGVLPPIANLQRVDPSSPVPAVQGVARPSPGALALVANAGFGGINTALVLRRWEAGR
ncbi:MAG: beta-ketoacyl-[acyl-carrier-protein] synthase family protein [Myxococcaceae bacterium]|nr:beta-ketoacyl-[acyl-carrier-protein] synthase family protein [Myxococcaceae bacterium]MCI0673308.1 beta-ketoacyl-[acyl-carrier-protein] synthase family protein [Myxococcaceae bacterium]